MKVFVNYSDKRWKKYNIDFERIANSVVDKKYANAEVSITLIDDKDIHKLNKEYRNIDKATNVLSFELNDDILLGDIFISLDTVKKEATAENISIEEHTAHMVVHGVLHLLGYDHITDSQAKVMEEKEIKILKKLGYKNPYEAEINVCSDYSCCRGSKFITFLKRFIPKENSIYEYIVLAFFGVAASFGFAPFYMGWLSLISIAVAYAIITRKKQSFKKAFLKSFAFCAFYSMSMFWWVLNSIYVVPELAQQFAVWTIPAILAIGIFGGILFSIPFVVIGCMCTVSSARPFLFAGIWTFVLWLREWFFTGFPWNPFANISMPLPILANSMSLWGALGLTFVLIGLIAAVVELIKNKKSRANWISFLIFFVLIIFGCVYGYKNIGLANNMQNATPMIKIVQPAKSAVQKASHSRLEALRNAEDNIKNLFALASSGAKTEIVIMPETSYPFVVDDSNMPLAHALNANLIIGATTYKNNALYNSMIISNSTGTIDKIYDKSHLVPFGEYRPLGDLIPTPGQLASGTGPEVISVAGFNFVPAICYEIIFSDSLVPKHSKNIDAIVNITNDTWFGATPGTYQHLDMVRRYAIESGLPIIRANYSGISAFVSSDGNVVSALSIGQSASLDGFVWGAHDTLYRKFGMNIWLIIILSFASICAISTYALQKKD